MGKQRPVVITALGVISPAGVGASENWRRFLTGPSAISRITRFDTSSLSCQIGGEVCDRDYEHLLELRKQRTTTHVTRLALAASILALQEARLGNTDPDLIGVCLGTAIGGLRDAEQQHSILMERGARRVNPFVVNGTPSHSLASEVASLANARGPQIMFSTGCTASLQAIAHASSLIANGDLEVCLAGGAESPLTPMVIAGMSRTGELSTLNSEPEHASCPFDRRHAGLVLSEGGCVVVLESAKQATRRGITPYAEILGFASSCDAKGMYEFDSSGQVGARALYRALERCNLGPADVDYVCAHANSSPSFDCKEATVLKLAFGEGVGRLPVSSIKGVLGHSFGASGAFQVAAGALAIRHQVVPLTYNLHNPAPGCDLDFVPHESRSVRIRRCLVTSYGYGGTNSYLIVGEHRSS